MKTCAVLFIEVPFPFIRVSGCNKKRHTQAGPATLKKAQAIDPD